ncbi:Reverse transcriptase domain-containing protein [Abeliophyllum distichum]|uniref:Reverse transcriptase domain-containing protein n=1 Tax=Abeliophyllum distichum TaxID=126358 RepID=A0ABD1V376_9LAMI
MGRIIDHCRVGAPPVDTVVTQASKPFITSDPKPAVASSSKPVVVLATKEVDTPVPIADRAGKGKGKLLLLRFLDSGSQLLVLLQLWLYHLQWFMWDPPFSLLLLFLLLWLQSPFMILFFQSNIRSHDICPSSNENVEVSIFSDTANSIQLEVHLPGNFCRNSSDDLTSVYYSGICFLIVDLRARLHQISLSVDGPWLVGRDFNVIAHNGERTGINTRDKGISDFTDMMKNCGLTAAGYSGSQYTWANGKWSSDDDLGPRPFRFLNVWSRHHDFLGFISQKWSFPTHLTGIATLQKDIFRLKQGLRWWNRNVFGDMFQRIRDVECRIDKAKLDHSRYHSPFYRNILHQAQLNQTPTLTEVREAILSIDPDSVTRLDGFSSHFFQVCWNIVLEDVFQAVLDFFARGHLPKDFVATSIVFLPKRDNACRWLEYRPISLCTVFNKLITKLMNLRLSTLLPQIISSPQNGLISGWLIGDNVLLVQELLHTFDTKVRGGNVILKVDMAKAYDRMDWSFLISIMEI